MIREKPKTCMFQREGPAPLRRDIAPLLPRQWEELALYKDAIPLNPNWDAYERAMENDQVRAYTARLFTNELIGYALFQIVERHAHYLHRWAINDILWIAPEHRNIGVGTALCECFEHDLRDKGPIVIHIETKMHAPALAVLLNSRGYDRVGFSLAKRFT